VGLENRQLSDQRP